MKTLIKIITVTLLILVTFSCKDDDPLSTQEKLIGKWKTLTYTENGVTPDRFTTCDLNDNYFYTSTKVFIEDFSVVDTSCIVDDNFSFDYTLNGNILRANNIDSEILEITDTFLKIRSVVNGGNTIKISTFVKVN